ncbi:hypothetical protein [Mucilaginibacter sp. 10I4]|uniref:hypothetical protein n=1 Tax=Mucilaginibacter sp. 10I4 TaxID=3048580 RepID=UPI002B23774C|nr:hypothetical protein [Mucilaginibacter sp. 10I4]MEB0262298.1 hypothetical protein [Mucilaginibacter sp. 10I4]
MNKPVILIYNDSYCQISINGRVTAFNVDSYTRQLDKGQLEENFLNDETPIIQRGWYSITILHKKNGKSQITIQMPMLPGGAAYFVENAQDYSENGRVNGHSYVNNWKSMKKNKTTQDSIAIVNTIQQKISAERMRKLDSVQNIANINRLIFKEDSLLKLGNNYNIIETGLVSKKINNELNKRFPSRYVYGQAYLTVDSTGLIIKCSKVLQAIGLNTDVVNEILYKLNIRTNPYIKSNKAYPSYFQVFLSNTPIIKRN